MHGQGSSHANTSSRSSDANRSTTACGGTPTGTAAGGSRPQSRPRPCVRTTARARWRKEKGHLLSSSASSQVTLSLLPCPSRFPLSHSSPLVLLLVNYTLLTLFLSLRLALSVSRCRGGGGGPVLEDLRGGGQDNSGGPAGRGCRENLKRFNALIINVIGLSVPIEVHRCLA